MGRGLGAIADGFEVTVVLSGATSIAMVSWMAWRAGKSQAAPPSLARARVLLHPWVQFLVVCGLLLVNQVFFNAYARAAHGGDMSFVAQYLPSFGFYGVPDAPIVRFVASHVPKTWLAFSVLRVQAFLELPFALLAYLAIARMLDRALYRSLVGSPLIVLASASFTATFCLVELALRNPWTDSDLVFRVASGLLTPAWLAWSARAERGGGARFPEPDGRPRGLLGLLMFFVGAAAAAYMVLIFYDVTLLYNVAHLTKYRVPLAVATLVASGAFLGVRKIDALALRVLGLGPDAAVPACVATSTSALVAFTAVFFVPSLVLRYWGQHQSAQILALLVVSTGALIGVVHEALLRRPNAVGVARWMLGAVLALAVGVVMSVTGAMGLVVANYEAPEEMLVWKVLLLALPALITWRICEALGTTRARA